MDATETPKPTKEMTPTEIIARVVELGFDSNCDRYLQFYDKLSQELPAGTAVALRGSVVTAQRWKDDAPFDADGKGTSDLDVTLIGDKVMESWNSDAFYIPAMHTRPLCDKDPGIAPDLEPLRRALQEIARRPVSFQATKDIVLFARDVLLGQPYYMLIEASA